MREAVEIQLALHGETHDGKAWLLSSTGRKRDAVRVAKSSAVLGEPGGGFTRFDHHAAVVMIPIHCVCIDRGVAVRKGLAA